MEFKIESHKHNEATVVSVEGDLDVYTAPQLRDMLTEAIRAAQTTILDLSECHFVDSTALGVLAAAHREAVNNRRTLRVVVSDPYVLKILSVTGFDKVFSLFSALTEALPQG